MKILLSAIVFLFTTLQLFGQSLVTFQIDLKDLEEQKLFSSSSGDEICIRGSFNNWEGNEYKLAKTPQSDLYKATFSFANVGDTVSYKYVIVKNKKYSFWEANPNFANTDNGNRQLIIAKDSMVLPVVHFHFDEYFRYPVIFSAQKLKEDFVQFRQILETTHPALYDYTSKQVLDSIFVSNYEKIITDTDIEKFIILLTEVIAKVGCGHSSIWVPNKFWYVAPEKLFPLSLALSEGKVFVKGSFNDLGEIPVGSEIHSINKQPIQNILQRLLSLTSADGFNLAYREAKVAQNFSVKYALAYGFFDSFVVAYTPPDKQLKEEKTILPVSKEMVDNANPKSTILSFRQIKNQHTGLLIINTFGYYSEVEMFKHFMDSVFLEINQQGITNLIMDLRGNSGGDPFCAAYLWTYLEPKALPYFADHYGKYDTLANPIAKAKYNFKGKLFTLIDGYGFSTTGHFCALLKYHKVGVFVGSELGSTYTCTGNATYPPLKNTGIMVGTARVQRYTAAVKNMNPQRGVLPDYTVKLTQDNIIDGKDAVMDYTLSLIR